MFLRLFYSFSKIYIFIVKTRIPVYMKIKLNSPNTDGAF